LPSWIVEQRFPLSVTMETASPLIVRCRRTTRYQSDFHQPKSSQTTPSILTKASFVTDTTTLTAHSYRQPHVHNTASSSTAFVALLDTTTFVSTVQALIFRQHAKATFNTTAYAHSSSAITCPFEIRSTPPDPSPQDKLEPTLNVVDSGSITPNSQLVRPHGQ